MSLQGDVGAEAARRRTLPRHRQSIETQTLELFQVCRARELPVLTCFDEYDRPEPELTLHPILADTEATI